MFLSALAPVHMILKEHILDDTTLILIHSCDESTDSLRITHVDVDVDRIVSYKLKPLYNKMRKKSPKLLYNARF